MGGCVVPHTDREKHRACVRRWNAANRPLLYSRYKVWASKPRGWAVCVLKNYRWQARAGAQVAMSITPDELVSVAELWDRSCQCCGRAGLTIGMDPGHKKATSAHVDHCHSTGKFRGFLCPRCNTRLGLLESGELQQQAAYLERFGNDSVP